MRVERIIDHYETLSVGPRADLNEIKRAYYDKVKEFHPDMNKDQAAEETFKKIVSAYETLKDPIKRQIYDLSRKHPNDFAHEGSAYHYNTYGESSPVEDRDFRYSEQQAYEGYWSTARKATENRDLREEYNQVKMQEAETAIHGLKVKIAMIVAAVVLYDLYRTYAMYKHKSFVDTQSYVYQAQLQDPVWVVERRKADLAKEVEAKQFRMEYSDQVIVTPLDKLKAKAQAKRERILGLDDYIKERQLKLQKTEDSYHNQY